MKKILYIVPILLLAACHREDPGQEELPPEKPVEIVYPSEVKATIADAVPVLGAEGTEGGLEVFWHEGDRISFFDNFTYNKEYVYAGNDGEISGQFKEVTSGETITGEGLDYVYAVYPFSDDIEVSPSGVITLTLPDEQTNSETCLSQRANTMISVTSGPDLVFKNLCGFLHLKLWGEQSVVSISVEGNGKEVIAGTADVDAKPGSAPDLSFRSSGVSNRLTLKCDPPVALGSSEEDATSFWIVVPPTEFPDGFTVTVTNSEGCVFEIVDETERVISRNTICEMPSFKIEKEIPLVDNVIHYTSSDGNVVVPKSLDVFGAGVVSNEYVDGQGALTFDGVVTIIGEEAFIGCETLTSIVLPEGVLYIGDKAFSGCSRLGSVDIPGNVSDIGNLAFEGCSDLVSIILPEGVGRIGDGAFEGCSSLESISVPEGVTSIGNRAFHKCTSLMSASLPESLADIGDSAFEECSSLKAISIPSGVSGIGTRAFHLCKDMESIQVADDNATYGSGGNCNAIIHKESASLIFGCKNSSVPEGVKSIGEWAFADCVDLEAIALPEGLTLIGDMAFLNCSGLGSVELPATVTAIGESAFSSCVGLKSVTFPSKGPLTIGPSAFSGCSGISSLTIPHGTTSIGEKAFGSCSGLESVIILTTAPPTGAHGMFDDTGDCPIYVFSVCADEFRSAENWDKYSDRIISRDDVICYTSTDGKIIKPHHTGKSVFGAKILSNEYYGGIGVLTFDGKVTSVGDSTFCTTQEAGRSRLTSIVIPDGVTRIGEGAFGCCFDLKSVSVPEGVTSFEHHCFYSCTHLESIYIPKTVRKIGERALASCYLLESLTIPEGITTIENWTFDSCTGLKFISLPKSLESIGRQAFMNCTSLESLTLPEGLTTIGHSAFYSCRALKTINIPDSVTELGEAAFISCSSLEIDTIPYGITRIGDSTFYGCGMKSFVIPSSVTSLGAYVFQGCGNLESVVIPDSVTSIGKWAFGNCYVLKSITIPKGVTKIEEATFCYCHEMTTALLPEGLRGIDKRAFMNCEKLESIKLPDSLEHIGPEAFSSCTELKSIVIPEKVPCIEKGAFYSCSALESIILPDGLTSIEDTAFYYCYTLSSLTLPEKLEYIGTMAFLGCSLDSIIIPEHVTNIGEKAFNWNNFGSVKVLATTPPEGGSFMFPSRTDYVIYVPEESYEKYRHAKYWRDYYEILQPF